MHLVDFLRKVLRDQNIRRIFVPNNKHNEKTINCILPPLR